MKDIDLILLTGISGAGKSTALKALEDLDFFCVDNLPASLVMPFAEEIVSKGDQVPRTHYALMVDCRVEDSFPLIEKAKEYLKSKGVSVELIFLDCNDVSAVRRFSETRRKHPLLGRDSKLRSISQAIERERELMLDFRNAASKVIDTSKTSVHDLRKQVEEFCNSTKNLLVTFQSFGFKYGVPSDLDLLFDVRFLPNPHFVEKLSQQTGISVEVREYVMSMPDTLELLEKVEDLLSFLIPKYKEEGKQYLTIGIGCTGGKHRSVVVAEVLNQNADKSGVRSSVFHRDIERYPRKNIG